ncbi:hypothetical protein OEA41_004277 [Lepraria neglecta]|uniref:Uncharacterized protein n=1 Tax=Lepraria neglecta TaxID=209136 RepID=A0AAE0DFL9_9LECA|nr:hypothetical protein OEA41_004277 [Lepraria neglecta]
MNYPTPFVYPGSQASQTSVQPPANTSHAHLRPPPQDCYSLKGIAPSDNIIRDLNQPPMPFFYGQLHNEPVLWHPMPTSDVVPQSQFAQTWQTPSTADNATQRTSSAGPSSMSNTTASTQSRSTTQSRSGTPRYFDIAFIQGVEDGRVSMADQSSARNPQPSQSKDAVQSALNGASILENDDGHVILDGANKKEDVSKSRNERADKRRRTGGTSKVVTNEFENTSSYRPSAQVAERACTNCRREKFAEVCEERGVGA